MSHGTRVAIGQYHLARDGCPGYPRQPVVRAVQHNTRNFSGADGYRALANLRYRKQRANDFGPGPEAPGNVPRNFCLRTMPGDASPARGRGFCPDCFPQTACAGALTTLRHFAERGKICHARLRDMRGCVPRPGERSPDEGNVAPVGAVRIRHEAGFDDFPGDGHAPAMLDDSVWRTGCPGAPARDVQALC